MKILITGITGFLASELIKRLYDTHDITGVARNETKLIELKQEYPKINIITGDIADEWVAMKAMQGQEQILHCCAYKHVGLAETNVFECANSNIVGTANLLAASIKTKPKQFISITTDKARRVSGIYGASKLIMEGLIREAEGINQETQYRTVLYGNILYSSGSVLCKWRDLIKENKPLIVTDTDATRFFWTVSQAVDLIFEAMEQAKDSTPYKPTVMKAMTVGDLLTAMIQKYNPDYDMGQIEIIGLQEGENKHETLGEGQDSNTSPWYTVEEIIKLI